MLKKIDQSLQTFEAGLAAGGLLMLLALSFFQIIIRNIFEFGYPEIDIINRHLLVLCGMMGAVLATSKRSHIKIDALNILLTPAVKNKLQLPLAVFASCVCALLCYYSVIFVADEWRYAPANERWTLPFTLTYPLCFSLMSFHFISNEIISGKQATQTK